MRVLGIDPGLARTGWGVIDKDERNGRLRVSESGCLVTEAETGLTERLNQLSEELDGLLRRVRPDEVAIEELYFSKASRTAASVGHARGVILLTLSKSSLQVYEYNPRRIKIALTGYGSADKSQMQRMTQTLLNLPTLPKPDDVADALAVALCHIHTAPLARSTARSAGGRP
ncbi:MAG TPA: crossover junction endodeoxyribonuclease RuvC [Elusimicrobiota bacterium]|nr:crossover junction endodeoxyribonuclease RuvC [Elusimicrobiota bacterium]